MLVLAKYVINELVFEIQYRADEELAIWLSTTTFISKLFLSVKIIH